MLIGDYLAAKRHQKGLTQKQAAKKLGFISPQYISNVERGEAEMSVKMFVKIAKIYGATRKEMNEVYINTSIKRLAKALKDAK